MPIRLLQGEGYAAMAGQLIFVHALCTLTHAPARNRELDTVSR